MGGGASKQRVATLKGHTNDVYAVASYTTQAGAVRVVSGSCDKTVRIWDPDAQRLLATLQGHTNWVYAVASYTTRAGAVRVVSGSEDETVKIWDPETQRLLATLQGHSNSVFAVASYTTQAGAVRVVSGSRDKTVRIWDPDAQRLLATLQGHSNSVSAVASYTTQAGAVRVVSGSCDKTVRIWDPDAQRLLATLQGHTNWVYAVASYTTQAGAVRVVSGSSDRTVRIWNPDTRRLLATLQGHTDFVNAVASYTTRAGAARVVSGSEDNTIKIWDPDTQRLLATLKGHTEDVKGAKGVHAVASYATQAGAVRVVSGSRDKTVKVWRTPEEKEALAAEARRHEAEARKPTREWSRQCVVREVQKATHDAALAARFANVDGARLHAATAGDEDDDPLGALLDEIELGGLAPRKAARAALEPFLAKLRARDEAAARERQRAAEAKREAEERAKREAARRRKAEADAAERKRKEEADAADRAHRARADAEAAKRAAAERHLLARKTIPVAKWDAAQLAAECREFSFLAAAEAAAVARLVEAAPLTGADLASYGKNVRGALRDCGVSESTTGGADKLAMLDDALRELLKLKSRHEELRATRAEKEREAETEKAARMRAKRERRLASLRKAVADSEADPDALVADLDALLDDLDGTRDDETVRRARRLVADAEKKRKKSMQMPEGPLRSFVEFAGRDDLKGDYHFTNRAQRRHASERSNAALARLEAECRYLQGRVDATIKAELTSDAASRLRAVSDQATDFFTECYRSIYDAALKAEGRGESRVRRRRPEAHGRRVRRVPPARRFGVGAVGGRARRGSAVRHVREKPRGRRG